MKLSTPVPLQTVEKQLDYDTRIVLLGSCFTENIGLKLAYYGFQTTVNPFGIVFNPVSLELLLRRSLTNDTFTETDVTSYFSYLAHSDLNGDTTQAVVDNLNNAGTNLASSIKNASHIFITLGTAWVYELKSTGVVVANCHKQPQDLFNKRLLSISEMTSAMNAMYQAIQHVNQNATITYTLSPVRHTKDGFVENQRSKARLHECIQQQVDTGQAIYFPAYEIVMDELRDYRFYDRDMLHLNDLGVDCVWERFRESVINTNAQQAMNAVAKYQQYKSHRPQDGTKHAIQLEIMRTALLNTYSNIHINEE
ncbi:MAG: GSCFA domain-containing protein [Nonlabens sp.]|nr:GSCFA domain-containing protein [Nonlabens sp.]